MNSFVQNWLCISFEKTFVISFVNYFLCLKGGEGEGSISMQGLEPDVVTFSAAISSVEKGRTRQMRSRSTRCVCWDLLLRKQVETPRKPGFLTNDFKAFFGVCCFDEFIDMKFGWIAMNCGYCHKNGFRISIKPDVQLTKGTLSQHIAAPGCGNPAYRCLLRCHNERLHQIPSPLQRPWPLQNGVRQSNYCRTRIVRVDVVGLDIFLFWLPCSKYGTLPHLCYTLICVSLFSWPAL